MFITDTHIAVARLTDRHHARHVGKTVYEAFDRHAQAENPGILIPQRGPGRNEPVGAIERDAVATPRDGHAAQRRTLPQINPFGRAFGHELKSIHQPCCRTGEQLPPLGWNINHGSGLIRVLSGGNIT